MVLNKLLKIGLSITEALLYLTMLMIKEYPESKIASLIPLDDMVQKEVIPLLIVKGLCEEISKNGNIILKVIKPKLGLINLLAYYDRKHETIFSQKIALFIELEYDLEKIYSKNVGEQIILN
jgi:hypothetical protein